MVFFRSTYDPVMPEPGGPGGLLAPQYLAAQLTLFQPGEGRLSQPITTAPPPPNFFTGISVTNL
jgi:hypothetical protein